MPLRAVLQPLVLTICSAVAAAQTGTEVDGAGPGDDTYKSNLYTVEVSAAGGWLNSYTYTFSRKSCTHWHQNKFPSVNFTTFGTGGEVRVRVTKLSGPISAVDISPKSKRIPAAVSGGNAVLTVNQNDKLWITVNGDDANPLFIFADGPKPPRPDGATYFGPGIREIAPTSGNHYKARSNEVIYLDYGAWVKGNIDLRGTRNVQILGPGILSGELWIGEKVHALPFKEATTYAMVFGDWAGNGCTVKGPAFVSSPGYNFFGGVHSATNVKLLSPWYYSTDGFQAVKCADHIFAFVGDNVFFPCWAGVNNENVTVTNSFAGTTNNAVFCGGFWGNDARNKCTAFVDNVDIKTYNSDAWVKHGSPLTPAVFQIWVDNNDSAKGYSNQTYQNIRIEGNQRAPLAQLTNRVYPWPGAQAPDPPLGNSFNLVFKNITLSGTQKGLSEIKGWDANNGFHNIVFENLSINGEHVSDANKSSFFDVNDFVRDLRFVQTLQGDPGRP